MNKGAGYTAVPLNKYECMLYATVSVQSLIAGQILSIMYPALFPYDRNRRSRKKYQVIIR